MNGVLQMAQNERNASMNNRMKLSNKGITKDHRKWKWKWMSFIYKSLAMELTVEVMLLNRIGSAGSTKKALISLASKLLSHVLRKIRSDRHWQDAPSIKAIRGERLMITWTRLVTLSPFSSPRIVHSDGCTRNVGQSQSERCKSTRKDVFGGQLTSDKVEGYCVCGVHLPRHRAVHEKVN